MESDIICPVCRCMMVMIGHYRLYPIIQLTEQVRTDIHLRRAHSSYNELNSILLLKLYDHLLENIENGELSPTMRIELEYIRAVARQRNIYIITSYK